MYFLIMYSYFLFQNLYKVIILDLSGLDLGYRRILILSQTVSIDNSSNNNILEIDLNTRVIKNILSKKKTR